MSVKCKSLFLLYRCATARHVTLLTKSLSCVTTQDRALPALGTDRWTHVQHNWYHQYHNRSSPITSFQILAKRQSAFKAIQSGFCTKTGETDEDAYESETEKNEVYIVHAKGLPWSCSSEDVLQFFSECMVRDGVNGIHLTLNSQGKPNGEAFIEMEHEEDVKNALKKHRQYLGMRYVEVYELSDSKAEAILKMSPGELVSRVPASGAPARSYDHHASHGEADHEYVVRIRGLPFSSTEEDIIDFFCGLDVLQDGVTIMRDHRGRVKGDAYVRFASQDMADKALERNRDYIGNRYIEVFPSAGRRRPGWQRGEQAPFHVGQPTSSHHSADQSGTAVNFVHMRGIPYQTTARDIAQFFAPLALARILIEYGPEGRPRGMADVYFRSHQDAVSAMTRDRLYMGDRYVELFLNSEDDNTGDD